jgi:hypothetical protein
MRHRWRRTSTRACLILFMLAAFQGTALSAGSTCYSTVGNGRLEGSANSQPYSFVAGTVGHTYVHSSLACPLS